MAEIMDILGSLIPDEQKDDIKSKIDGELKNREITIKKEASRKYGIDLFQEDVDKAYENKNFVKVENFNEIKIQNETLLEEKTNLQNEIDGLKSKSDLFETSIELVKRGFNPDKLEFVDSIIKNEDDIDKKIETLQQKVPEFFAKVVVKNQNPQPNGKDKTGAELYREQQMKKI